MKQINKLVSELNSFKIKEHLSILDQLNFLIGISIFK